jgi:CRISPR-associated endonuclease Csn1
MYDWALLKDALKDGDSVSAGKVKIYEQHHRDLHGLKLFIRKYMPDKYGEIFRRIESNNYVAYSYNVKSVKGDIAKVKKASAVDFCDYLRRKVKDIKVEAVDQFFYEDMLARLGVCQDKCVSFFAIRKAVRKGRLFYGKKLKIARTLAFFPEFFHQ